MSDQQHGPPKKGFEHSRYRDWRPSYREEEKPKRRRRRGAVDRRQGSVFGFLFRLILWIALFLALIGPGIDWVNGMAKAPEGACQVRVVIDGDSLWAGCPDGADLPLDVAGYDAPDLFPPSCLSALAPALMASLEIRKILLSADTISLRSAAGPVALPDPAGAEPGAAEVDVVPAAPTPLGGTRVLVDGVDVADRMLASGYAQLPGEATWCQ